MFASGKKQSGFMFSLWPMSLSLCPCKDQEADSRIFLHEVEQQIKSVLVKACDTDILVLAVRDFQTLLNVCLEELWIEFGRFG